MSHSLPWDLRFEVPPNPPRDAVSGSGMARPQVGWNSRVRGRSWHQGGFPRAPAPAPAAGSGGRGGAVAGNRLDDGTLTGGRRVPQGRESCDRLEHLGICSPGGAGRNRGHFHLETGAIHFTDSKNEDQKIEGALDGDKHTSPDLHFTLGAGEELLSPSPHL